MSFNYVREPGNGFTHLFGAILSFVGLLALVIKTSIVMPTPLAITSVIIFGISMILLYTASTVYHLVISSDKVSNAYSISYNFCDNFWNKYDSFIYSFYCISFGYFFR